LIGGEIDGDKKSFQETRGKKVGEVREEKEIT
jgi:hypothetical protein